MTLPLTTLPSKELEKVACDMWQSLQLYTGVVIERQGVDYHVKLAQTILQQVPWSTPRGCSHVCAVHGSARAEG